MRNRRGNLKRNKTFTVIFLGIGILPPTNIMYIVLILTDTNTQFWKLAKKGESWFRKMFHPIFTTYIPVYFKYNMSNKIERSVIPSDRRRSSISRLSKVVIEAKRLKSHKKACEDFDN